MDISHCSLMGVHLGTRKTKDGVPSNFFWPGCAADVKRFCQSCDVCQRTMKRGTVPKVPLQKMPLIDAPVKRVAVDIVGPIKPASSEGHRYILTLMDYTYREVLQSSTGFVPFELLYGREVRGPMGILRELWTGEKIAPQVKTSFQYVFDPRKRLEETMAMARGNLEETQSQYKSQNLLVRVLGQHLLDRQLLVRVVGQHLFDRQLLLQVVGQQLLLRVVGQQLFLRVVGQQLLLRVVGQQLLLRVVGQQLLLRVVGHQLLLRVVGQPPLRVVGQQLLLRVVGQQLLLRVVGSSCGSSAAPPVGRRPAPPAGPPGPRPAASSGPRAQLLDGSSSTGSSSAPRPAAPRPAPPRLAPPRPVAPRAGRRPAPPRAGRRPAPPRAGRRPAAPAGPPGP
ncbi:hypothetical protein C7M84_021755 [Penaeus vannamei]|uniref:Integrase zinc-binding domain-containing protein n=1 Tax=Penaeus vannamei TaxID=6689 RepID=A0A423U8D8_PENVA|nr:hypothetical protein C7M84_021755 [Penaeus vannamei]